MFNVPVPEREWVYNKGCNQRLVRFAANHCLLVLMFKDRLECVDPKFKLYFCVTQNILCLLIVFVILFDGKLCLMLVSSLFDTNKIVFWGEIMYAKYINMCCNYGNTLMFCSNITIKKN